MEYLKDNKNTSNIVWGHNNKADDYHGSINSERHLFY